MISSKKMSSSKNPTLIDVSDRFLKAFMGAAVRRYKGIPEGHPNKFGIGRDVRVFKPVTVEEISLLGVLHGEMSIHVIRVFEGVSGDIAEYYLCKPPSSLTAAVEVWGRSLELLKSSIGKNVRIAYIPENFIVSVYEI